MPEAYEPVIGLEIHTQLKTASKLFCGCPTLFGAAPNHHTCPLCMGMPGTLPVLNRRAVDFAVKLGLAVGATVHLESVFARKNYFYPDLPKGYQISQFDKPICTGGGLWIETEDRGRRFIRIHRIHMEEDAGKSSHTGEGGSKVDLNRAGVPLCEIVSEADMRSPEEAMAYMKAIRSILRYLEVSDGNMEEGSLRCDANISLRPAGTEPFGTKSELKNINSFRFVGQALHYEIGRQTELLQNGGEVEQDTRLWDTKRQVSVKMRGKENAHDYRYFPEPDLIPLILDANRVRELEASLPELADARAQRFAQDFGLPPYDAGVLCAERALADYFEEGARKIQSNQESCKALSNWIMGEVLRRLKEEGKGIEDAPISSQRIVELVALIEDGTISGKIAKKVFEEMWAKDEAPDAIVEAKGWKQVSDAGAIDGVIQTVLERHPGEVEDFRSGKDKLFGFFVGQVMRETRGQANPKLVNERLRALLSEG